ncbi:unnamed protein product [Ranitomeya imitator]|uniref:Tc1-like transposase DDE domain-containing protein n=1 Tax=Ranitomeya imitator TaxID=111125 RepID=A0ABN9M5L2_9NEOB|nr:unnamed protein product [Ranitomeya imitator]
MGLNPDVVIPTSYFHRDVKESILQLALEMQSVYQQVSHDSAQGVSSAEAKSVIKDKDSQHLLFHALSAKLVREELLLQIHMYNILDAYSKIQTENCAPEIKKALCKMNLRPSYGKSAAEEAAKRMEKQHVEKIIIFLKKSFKDQQKQMSLNEMQTQLKEEHGALTEQLLQEENTVSLREMSTCPDTRNIMDHAVCFSLAQRHFRQAVVLLQEVFKAQQRDEYDNSVVAGQEEILNLFNNKTEAKLLLTDLQQVIKRIRLRERHLGEIASGLKEFCSDKVHILSCVEEAHYLEYELQAFIKQQLKSLKEELEECSRPERQSVVEEKKCLKSLQEKQAEVEEAHRKQISEENLKLQDQLERGELNGSMKQKLIREHDETITFLEKTLQRDLEKLNVKLEEELRIKERLENVGRRHQNSETDATTAGKMNLSNNDQKILSLMTDHINIFHQTEQIAAARTTLLGPYLFSSVLPPALHVIAPSELRTSQQRTRETEPHAALERGTGLKNTFRDVQDLQSNCEGDLSVIDPKELSARELVTYEYGTDILESLKLHIKTGNLHLHVTSYIPRNNYNGNAFSHSFFYQDKARPHVAGVCQQFLQDEGIEAMDWPARSPDLNPIEHIWDIMSRSVHQRHIAPQTVQKLADALVQCIYGHIQFVFLQSPENILFVSREYLQSVGSLILLVVHCFAHFAVGDFNDDSNPLFLRMFYQALKVCLYEGFLPRLQLQSSQSQCNNVKCVDGGDRPPSKMISKEMTDQLSTLISPRFDVLMDYRKPLKTFEEIISGNDVEAILKTKLAPWKLQFFASCEPQICAPEKGEDKEWSTAEHLQDELDELDAELALILKKEVDLRRNVMDVDGPSYQLQMVLAEKDCLINRIVKMEEKARILSSMV